MKPNSLCLWWNQGSEGCRILWKSLIYILNHSLLIFLWGSLRFGTYQELPIVLPVQRQQNQPNTTVVMSKHALLDEKTTSIKTVVFDRVFAFHWPCAYPDAVLRHASGPTSPPKRQDYFPSTWLSFVGRFLSCSFFWVTLHFSLSWFPSFFLCWFTEVQNEGNSAFFIIDIRLQEMILANTKGSKAPPLGKCSFVCWVIAKWEISWAKPEERSNKVQQSAITRAMLGWPARVL